MNYTYKLIRSTTGIIASVLRKEDEAQIPFDEENTDYQEYLLWVAEGNTAEDPD